MAIWKWKGVTATESVNVKDTFRIIFAKAYAPKEYALFSGTIPDSSAEVNLLTPAGTPTIFNSASPGGWQEIDPDEVRNWILLVGNASAPNELGVSLG